MNFRLFFLLASFTVTSSFISVKNNFCRPGIKGYVFIESGNRMPSPDRPLPKPKGLQTTLYIYQLTNVKDVSREGESGFYSRISTSLVKTVTTSKTGRFKVKLPPGFYSLFIKKDSLFYSSSFDEKNNICPVEVKAGEMTDFNFTARYNASY